MVLKRTPQLFPVVSLLAILISAFAFSGCKVTAEDVETWKTTVKGPRRMLAVLKSKKYDMELRTRAALALVEMEPRQEPAPFKGIIELKEALDGMQDQAEKSEIIERMAPGLIAHMSGTQAAASNTDRPGPPPTQTRAKDAAFLLIPQASESSKQQLTRAILNWYTADFNGRSLAGDYNAEQIVNSLGSDAAGMLVDAMEAKMPQAALVKLAELVARVGDDEAKTRAGQRIVAIEQEMEGADFLGWLKEKVRRGLAQTGQERTDPQLVVAAELNRGKFINEAAIPAMKHLAGQPNVAQRLLQMAEVESASAAMIDRRKFALQALEGHATAAHHERLLTLALNESTPVVVRDYAFDRIGDIRSPDAIPRLWPLFTVTENDEIKKRLRWRAGALILAIGGGEVVGEFLRRMPNEREIQYEPAELEGYATRISQMQNPNMRTMRRLLNADEWWKRVLGLRFLERKGNASDKARIRRQISNQTALAGAEWRDNNTIGKIAQSALSGLETRLSGGEAAAAAGASMAPTMMAPTMMN